MEEDELVTQLCKVAACVYDKDSPSYASCFNWSRRYSSTGPMMKTLSSDQLALLRFGIFHTLSHECRFLAHNCSVLYNNRPHISHQAPMSFHLKRTSFENMHFKIQGLLHVLVVAQTFPNQHPT